MNSPGLAVLPCLWVAWSIIGVIITCTMTITEGHYLTPYISISDTGANFPESIVMWVVSTVSALLDAAIMYVMYRLYVIKTAERTRTGDILQKVLLAVGWLSCVGSIISTYLQDFTVSDYINIVVLVCSALHTIFQTELPVAESKKRQCILITWVILSVLQFLAFMSTSGYFPIYVLLTVITCNIVIISDCTSDSCIQNLSITLAILEWLIFLFSCIDYILLYRDFQALTIKLRKSLKEDWIILRDDLEKTLPLYRES